MKHTLSHKTKLLNIAKVLIVLVTLGFIVYKVFFDQQIKQMAADITFLWTPDKVLLIVSVFLLIIPNLLTECIKWMITMRQHEQVNFVQAVQSVTAGIALGIITPNHLGDLAGKALFLQSYDKLKGTAASSISSISQMLAILICGSFGLWITLGFKHQFTDSLFYCGFILILLLLALTCFMYLNIHWLNNIFRWKKISPYIEAFTHYSTRELSQLLLYSLLRFGIFNLQYFLLLWFFDVNIPALLAFPALAAIFLVQSSVPSFLLVEMGVRGASAIFFLGMFSPHIPGILLATYVLWIVNIMFPGLTGLVFILKLKYKERTAA